jgi:hypothetical protein
MRNLMKKIITKKTYEVPTEKKKFVWIGERKKIRGGSIYEFNPISFGLRQIVEIPTDILMCDKILLFGKIPIFWKNYIVFKERFQWKNGMLYTQSAKKEKAISKIQKYLNDAEKEFNNK